MWTPKSSSKYFGVSKLLLIYNPSEKIIKYFTKGYHLPTKIMVEGSLKCHHPFTRTKKINFIISAKGILNKKENKQ